MMNWAKGSETAQGHSAATSQLVVNVPSQTALLTDIAEKFQAGEGFSVATLNLDHVTKIRTNPEFRAAYQQHSHVTADGNPIVWLSRLSGQPIQLVPGSELIAPLVQLAGTHRIPVALFGATQEGLDKAGNALEAQYSGVQVVARIAPEMGFDPTSAQADDYADALSASGARLCFLALGAPKQEIFAIQAHKRHPHMGFVSIGAGLDFISGDQIRAPRLVRRFALEWLWRLVGNPRRLARRYRDCFAILPALFYTAWRSRSNREEGV